jgi:hypothetical protein
LKHQSAVYTIISYWAHLTALQAPFASDIVTAAALAGGTWLPPWLATHSIQRQFFWYFSLSWIYLDAFVPLWTR